MTTHSLLSPIVATGRWLREFTHVYSEARRMAELWESGELDIDELRELGTRQYTGTATRLTPRAEADAGNITAHGTAA